MDRLKRRAEFLAVATGPRAPSPTLILQTLRRPDAPVSPAAVRVGFTVSKKVGNSVERNRVRRRLREAVRLAPGSAFHAGHDYVLVGRRAALNTPFERIMEDVRRALKRVHSDGNKPRANASPQSGKRQEPR